LLVIVDYSIKMCYSNYYEKIYNITIMIVGS
jgi:hypothetical protein